MGHMIVQHHLQFIQSDIKKSYPKREKQKLILVRKNQEKHCKVFVVWECSVFRLSLAKIFCQSRISPKENSGASGGFLPTPSMRESTGFGGRKLFACSPNTEKR